MFTEAPPAAAISCHLFDSEDGIDLFGLTSDVDTDKTDHRPENYSGDLPGPEFGIASESDSIGEHRPQQDQNANCDQ